MGLILTRATFFTASPDCFSLNVGGSRSQRLMARISSQLLAKESVHFKIISGKIKVLRRTNDVVEASSMTDTSLPNDASQANSVDSQTMPISRRSALKKSALLTTFGSGSLGAGLFAGTAAAAGACGEDNPDEPNTVDYVFEKGDDKIDYANCGDGILRGQKTVHSASTQYLGSAEDLAGEWTHFFQLGGHSEYYDGGFDCGTWDHAAGITEHKATIDNKDGTNDALDPANDHDVAGLPAAGSDSGLIGDLAQELAMTALTEAMAYYYGGWAGAAAGIAVGMLADSENNNTIKDSKLAYDWDYGSSYKKCGSHFVDFDLEGNESASLNVTDEAWGMYPNYTQIYKEIDFLDATETSDASLSTSTTTTDLTSRNSGSRRHVEVGDIIETTNGDPIEVTDVEVTASRTPGRSPSKVSSVNDLPQQVQHRIGDKNPVRYAEFPAEVRTISISGERLE